MLMNKFQISISRQYVVLLRKNFGATTRNQTVCASPTSTHRTKGNWITQHCRIHVSGGTSPGANGADCLSASERAEIDRFGDKAPTPMSLRGVLDSLESWSSAKFLHDEYPVRCAERITMIESILGWDQVPELREAHSRHTKAFFRMRDVKPKPTDLDDFTAIVQDIVNGDLDMTALMARGMQRLSTEREDEFNSAFVDRFLDEFLLNRIGSVFLMKQYLACSQPSLLHVGILDPNCNVKEVCRESARAVQRVCKRETGKRPIIDIEAYSTAGSDNGEPIFPYVPEKLRYIVQELLKNSCRATVDNMVSRPVSVVVCADEHRIMIQISDRAGGIPFDVGQRVWSYLYTTASKRPTELAGYGVGLPLSRLYARYLGGSLKLVSLPGYGTHAYLYLPRISSEQVEVVPDKDHDWKSHGSAGKFVL